MNFTYLRILTMTALIAGMGYILEGDYFHLFTTGLFPSILLIIVGLFIIYKPWIVNDWLSFLSKTRLASQVLLACVSLVSFLSSINPKTSSLIANSMAYYDVVCYSFVLFLFLVISYGGYSTVLKPWTFRVNLPISSVKTWQLIVSVDSFNLKYQLPM